MASKKEINSKDNNDEKSILINKAIIESSITLSRNFEDYFFLPFLTYEDAEIMTEEVKQLFKGKKKYTFKTLKSNKNNRLSIEKNNNDRDDKNSQNIKDNENVESYESSNKNEKNINIKLGNKNYRDKIYNDYLVASGFVSKAFVNSEFPKAYFIKDDKNVIMTLNEKEHIKIVATLPGEKISDAYDEALELEQKVGSNFKYSFDKNFGYLSSNITSAGMGLNASYLIHIPMLEISGQIADVIGVVAKLGIAIKPKYMSTDGVNGGFYYISMQGTYGASEKEIIQTLRSVTLQILEKEIALRNEIIVNERAKIEDEIFRSYGILTNAKLMSEKEAILLLSYIKFGADQGFLNEKKVISKNIYGILNNIMEDTIIYNMTEDNIKYKNMKYNFKKEMNKLDIDSERANIIKMELLT